MSEQTIQERIEIIKRHLASARERIILEGQGWAWRSYDVTDDSVYWHYKGRKWAEPRQAYQHMFDRYQCCDRLRHPVCRGAELEKDGPGTLSDLTPHAEIVVGEANLAKYKARLAAGEEFV